MDWINSNTAHIGWCLNIIPESITLAADNNAVARVICILEILTHPCRYVSLYVFVLNHVPVLLHE